MKKLTVFHDIITCNVFANTAAYSRREIIIISRSKKCSRSTPFTLDESATHKNLHSILHGQDFSSADSLTISWHNYFWLWRNIKINISLPSSSSSTTLTTSQRSVNQPPIVVSVCSFQYPPIRWRAFQGLWRASVHGWCFRRCSYLFLVQPKMLQYSPSS